MRRTIAVALALAPVLAGTPAGAAWTPARLASASDTEQAIAASTGVALAAGGRYVVFSTVSRNLFRDPEPSGAYRRGGIFRKDLATGELELVAPGEIRDAETDALLRPGAFGPSISADGRYVAFTTAAELLPSDSGGGRLDVYVRDMARPAGDPAALELASALDGGETGATYGGDPGGAFAPPRAAISADGRSVAFVTQAGSNLPAGGAPDVVAGQLLVRRLDTRRTLLVTTRRDAASGAMTTAPAGGATDVVNVALSGDGGTVVWAGRNGPDQVPYVDGEPGGPNDLELLWRRIADGPGAATRRVATVGDPDDPACPPGGSITEPNPEPRPVRGACDGPFGAVPLSDFGGPLAVSADGYRVAYATAGRPRGVVAQSDAEIADLMLADMSPGLSRKQGHLELTREGADPLEAPAILGVGLSADGRTVAFTTERVRFALSEPTFVGRANPSLGGPEVYAIDLAARTLELVTRAWDGGQAHGNVVVAGPTLSADGSRIGFFSSATDLVRGDGNSAEDAFVVDRVSDRALPLDQRLPALVQPDDPRPARTLRARLRPRRDGTILVEALVPGAGRLAAVARGRVRARSTSARRRKRSRVVRVSRATTVAGGPGLVVLRLRPSPSLARLVRRRRGLPVDVRVAFAQPGAAQLSQTHRSAFRRRIR